MSYRDAIVFHAMVRVDDPKRAPVLLEWVPRDEAATFGIVDTAEWAETIPDGLWTGAACRLPGVGLWAVLLRMWAGCDYFGEGDEGCEIQARLALADADAWRDSYDALRTAYEEKQRADRLWFEQENERHAAEFDAFAAAENARLAALAVDGSNEDRPR